MWVRFPSPALKNMRLADILKRNSQNAQKTSPQRDDVKPAEPAVPQPKMPSPAANIPNIPKVPQPAHVQNISDSGANEKTYEQQSFTAEDVYSKAVSEIKSIITHFDKGTPLPSKIECINELVSLIESNNDAIIMLADRATPDIYIYGHSVNVSIFSLILGQAFGLDRERMINLGFCAFLHDIGIIKVLNVALKKEPLTENEQLMIKKHPLYGQDMIRKLSFLPDSLKNIIIEVMIQHNDRKTKYNESQPSDIHVFSRIIAIADIYEALTHPRTYRERTLPHLALKAMINSADHNFDTEIIKAFIDTISLYPPGSYVRLNSDEIARVININPGLPTRPKVKVIINAAKERMAELKILDLASTPMIFIKEPIDETKLVLPDNRLLVELKAIRWWVKGL